MGYYTKVKAAMAAKGYAVSEGDDWSTNDKRLYREYSHFYLGVNEVDAETLIMHPEYFAEKYPAAQAKLDEDAGAEPPEEGDDDDTPSAGNDEDDTPPPGDEDDGEETSPGDDTEPAGE